MAKYKAISFDKIADIASRAAGGDTSALAELGRLNSKYGRAANQRARELEKRGMETGAYVRAQDKLGKDRPRFSQAKTGDAENLYRSLQETVKFLNYQTSSISGEMTRRENVLKGLEKLGYNVGADRKKFLDFLDSKAWDEIRGMFGSKDAMQSISDNLAKGASIGELMAAYEKFKSGESEAEDILQVWDGWTSEKDNS